MPTQRVRGWDLGTRLTFPVAVCVLQNNKNGYQYSGNGYVDFYEYCFNVLARVYPHELISLGRAVEQLAGCLSYQGNKSHVSPYEYLIR